MICSLRRVVLLAPSLAILLLLTAAGAASAADELDPIKAPPTVTPILSQVGTVKERAITKVVEAVPKVRAQEVRKIVDKARDAVRLLTPAPVPIPPVILPDLFDGPVRVDEPRQTHPPVTDHPDPTPDLPSVITMFATQGQATLLTRHLDGSMRLRPLRPSAPLGLFDLAGTATIGGSGVAPGPWLGHVALAHAAPAWRSGAQQAVPSAIPRGLTPRPLVPPG